MLHEVLFLLASGETVEGIHPPTPLNTAMVESLIPGAAHWCPFRIHCYEPIHIVVVTRALYLLKAPAVPDRPQPEVPDHQSRTETMRASVFVASALLVRPLLS
jgi:hypothetical protein